jgi:cyclopropane fatty-acyl-phospholipid synthase-like methyltransferase
MEDMLNLILGVADKPTLFEPGEPEFWCDPHISKSMLDAHLDPDHDSASRRPAEINQTVCHLFASGVLVPGMRVLDIGCGPGLYDIPLSRAGMHVTGIDFSERSIAYAKKQASIAGLDITYRCMDFFDMDFSEKFDAVLQIYGEFNTFADEKRDRLLGLIHLALKKSGEIRVEESVAGQRGRILAARKPLGP